MEKDKRKGKLSKLTKLSEWTQNQLELAIALAIFLGIAIIYAGVSYVTSYDFVTNSSRYKETMEWINNYDTSHIDRIDIDITHICELEGMSFSVRKEEDPELFNRVKSLVFNDAREYHKNTKDYRNGEGSCYITFIDEDTMEKLVLSVYFSYDVIRYEDCIFKSSDELDYSIIEELVKRKNVYGE